MLRPYFYTYSKIVKVQSFVNHVMLDVIFRASKIPAVTFSSDLVLSKYKSLIDDVNEEYILTPLVKAFEICKGLKPKDLKTLKRAVHNNNKIRELCNGVISPVKYSEIQSINQNLSIAIKTFCDSLYDDSIDLAPFYKTYENVDDYYKKVVKRSSVCRCCGINKVLTQFHKHRSALDHYLPRKHYPFNSLNFKNLIPICDTCNSKYKLSEDTLYKTENKGKKSEVKKRVKAFYPFCRITPDIKIALKFNKPYNSTIEPDAIEINLSCPGFEEQVETWDRIFGIKENYKAQCCTDEMFTYFEEQYIASMNHGFTHEEYLKMLSNNKYGDMNFLKIPFLEEINTNHV